MNALLHMDIQYLFAAIIITYMPFHFLEEAIGDFPSWMFVHHWNPDKLTYGHWMANNIFFYFPLVVLGLISFHFMGDKLLFVGAGLIVFGFVETLVHLTYTMIDRKVSPGLFTSFIFCIISVLSLYILDMQNKLTLITVLLSVVFGLIYSFLPILFCIIFHKTFKKIFG